MCSGLQKIFYTFSLAFALLISTNAHSQTITTIAGNGETGYSDLPGGYSGDGGPAKFAEFLYVTGVAIDATGNIYIADSGNNRVRKIDANTGIITTIAGDGKAGYSGDGGLAIYAELNRPTGLAIDASGNVYIADANNSRIRKLISSSGIITTIAGDGYGNSGDGGLATSAKFESPESVAVDAPGNVYIADERSNHVRKVNARTGIITNFAGDSVWHHALGDKGPAISAMISSPSGVAVDAHGNIYIADAGNNRVRKVTASTGIITTIAGTGHSDPAPGVLANVVNADPTLSDAGEPALATPLRPEGVAVDAHGNIYIADAGNNRVRKLTVSKGVVTTIAGFWYGGGLRGGYFPRDEGRIATTVPLNHPRGLAIDASGNVYFADEGNKRIRKIQLSPSDNSSTNIGAQKTSPNSETLQAAQTTTNGQTFELKFSTLEKYILNSGRYTPETIKEAVKPTYLFTEITESPFAMNEKKGEWEWEFQDKTKSWEAVIYVQFDEFGNGIRKVKELQFTVPMSRKVEYTDELNSLGYTYIGNENGAVFYQNRANGLGAKIQIYEGNLYLMRLYILK